MLNLEPETSSDQKKKKKGRGSFFLVDVPTFSAVCALGDADVAASYLILCAGTGADNRTSSWSREAINQRTALNWRKADACVAKLEAEGFLRWLSPKGTRKTRIDLPPIELRKPMQRHVAVVVHKISEGWQPETPSEKGAATIALDSGWLKRNEIGDLEFIESRPLVKAYLPNALVGDELGKANGQSTVVDRIRLSRDAHALQLLVDLYGLQDLAENGGIARSALFKKFERTPLIATGSLQAWVFDGGSEWVSWVKELKHHRRKLTVEDEEAGISPGTNFFERMRILRDAGALEWVLYLAEDDQPDSTRIYPVAVLRHQQVVWSEIESIVGGYAVRAACSICDDASESQAVEWESELSFMPRLVADRMARQAALVGVPRLRFRANTSNADRWRHDLMRDANDAISMFRGIIAEHAPHLLHTADQRFADFNDASTVSSKKSSTVPQRDINDPSKSSIHGDTSRDDAKHSQSFVDQVMQNYYVEMEEHRRATGQSF